MNNSSENEDRGSFPTFRKFSFRKLNETSREPRRIIFGLLSVIAAIVLFLFLILFAIETIKLLFGFEETAGVSFGVLSFDSVAVILFYAPLILGLLLVGGIFGSLARSKFLKRLYSCFLIVTIAIYASLFIYISGEVSKTPFIQVLSPSGGEAFCVGQEISIQWEYRDIEEVKLVVYEPSGISSRIGPDRLPANVNSQGEGRGLFRWRVGEELVRDYPGYRFSEEKASSISIYGYNKGGFEKSGISGLFSISRCE